MFARGASKAKPVAKSAALPVDDPHYGAGANLPAAAEDVDRSATEFAVTVVVTVQAVYLDRAKTLLTDAIASCNGKIAGATFEVA